MSPCRPRACRAVANRASSRASAPSCTTYVARTVGRWRRRKNVGIAEGYRRCATTLDAPRSPRRALAITQPDRCRAGRDTAPVKRTCAPGRQICATGPRWRTAHRPRDCRRQRGNPRRTWSIVAHQSRPPSANRLDCARLDDRRASRILGASASGRSRPASWRAAPDIMRRPVATPSRRTSSADSTRRRYIHAAVSRSARRRGGVGARYLVPFPHRALPYPRTSPPQLSVTSAFASGSALRVDMSRT